MPTPSWQYHEPDHPGADFDAIAEDYDRNMRKVRDVEAEINEVLEFLDLRPEQSVLELGTGTGEFALAASRQCSRVYAVDLSLGMLRYAEKKAAARDIRNVEFLPGGFLTYEHYGPLVDAAVTQIALHHLPDNGCAARRHRRKIDGGDAASRRRVAQADIAKALAVEADRPRQIGPDIRALLAVAATRRRLEARQHRPHIRRFAIGDHGVAGLAALDLHAKTVVRREFHGGEVG